MQDDADGDHRSSGNLAFDLTIVLVADVIGLPHAGVRVPARRVAPVPRGSAAREGLGATLASDRRHAADDRSRTGDLSLCKVTGTHGKRTGVPDGSGDHERAIPDELATEPTVKDGFTIARLARSGNSARRAESKELVHIVGATARASGNRILQYARMPDAFGYTVNHSTVSPLFP